MKTFLQALAIAAGIAFCVGMLLGWLYPGLGSILMGFWGLMKGW